MAMELAKELATGTYADLSTDQLRRKLVEAEGARALSDRLHLLTAGLSNAAEPEDVAQVVIDHVQACFPGVAGVVVARTSRSGDSLDLMRARDMSPEVFDSWRSIPLSARTPLTDTVRGARPIFLESLDEWQAMYPDLYMLALETGHQAQMVGPLIVGARTVGAIGVAFRQSRKFIDEERDLFMSVAGQCAVALERARLFESEREARTIAERANKAKGDFLAAMSHELRTPLNAIAGHVDLLSLNLYGPTTPEQQVALGRVKRAEQHLLGIVDELLSFARLERGRVDYHIAAVKVQDVVDDLLPMVNPLFGAKTIEFRQQISDPFLYAYADRGKLTQILINVLSNAAKFTTSGGTVTLEARESIGQREGDKPRVEISVTDSGMGIPTEKLDAVFDPFVQLDTDPATRQQGTGLGLAISRDLARGMGGDIVARSTPGVSTTFTLMLPAAGVQPAT